MKILVTGGLGFIGSHVVDLISRNENVEVEIFDSKEEGGKWKRSIRNRERVKYALEGVDRVYHLAALTSAPDSIKYPKAFWNTNVEGTRNIVENFDGPMIFASSAAVHEPLNPYALTKVVCEDILKGREQTKICRFYNVFGEGDNKGVVYQFIKRALLDRDIEIYGDGKQTRSLIYVKDLASNMMFCEGNVTTELADTNISIIELANYIKAMCDSKSNIVFKDKRQGDPMHSGYHAAIVPDYGFVSGIERTIEWNRRKILGIKNHV